ncbi:hypothetical protein JVU11DRAFT_7955 [Chiua virens]|nr:hypothetical protein JVU11DRAFT_7955 [Chiua virens]
MAMAMFALRLQVCLTDGCFMMKTLLIIQTISTHHVFFNLDRCLTQVTADCIADVLLSALPIWSLRKMRLSRNRKILVSSAFWASMAINIVTVVEAVTLFQSTITSGSIVYEHVKVACSMIVCNLLVIVTFVYRILHEDRTNLDDSILNSDGQVFSTVVDLAQVSCVSQDTNKGSSSFPWRRPLGTTMYDPRHSRPFKTFRSMATSSSYIDVER